MDTNLIIQVSRTIILDKMVDTFVGAYVYWLPNTVYAVVNSKPCHTMPCFNSSISLPALSTHQSSEHILLYRFLGR